MYKKISGLVLLVTLLSVTPVFASARSDKALPAAPALAVEILKEHEVKPAGDILKMVASQMEADGSFMGVSKEDPMYKHHVMHYLHCTLEVIPMDHDCMDHAMAE